MKSLTNSARSSWVRPAQWRESARRASSSKSNSPRAIRLISARRVARVTTGERTDTRGARRNRSKAEYFRRAFNGNVVAFAV